MGHLQDVVAVGGEAHHHADVEQEELVGQLFVELLLGTLRQSLSQHDAHKLDFIQRQWGKLVVILTMPEPESNSPDLMCLDSLETSMDSRLAAMDQLIEGLYRVSEP